MDLKDIASKRVGIKNVSGDADYTGRQDHLVLPLSQLEMPSHRLLAAVTLSNPHSVILVLTRPIPRRFWEALAQATLPRDQKEYIPYSRLASM